MVVRLAGALTREGLGGSLSGPVKGLGTDELEQFRQLLAERVETFTIVPMAQIVWSMADLQQRHRPGGRLLSALSAEALASAHHLGAAIAVAEGDVGPGLQAAAAADGVAFVVVER